MSNSVLLSSNIRSNLLALQNSADLLGVSQERLSTGKKVNSALDNASSFFTASKLSDKASNLNSLLDGIGSSIQTIKAANQGASSIVSLLKTAKGIAEQAKAASTSTGYSATSSTAQTTGTGSTLAQKAGNSLLTATGNNIAASDTLTFSSTDANGTVTSKTFTVNGTSTVNDLASAINASGVATVKVEDNGTLTFASKGNLTVTSSDTSQNSLLGFSATAGVVSATAGAATASTDYSSQFRDTLAQIDKIVQDSGYNGTNLLAGGLTNQMSVKFDDRSDSKVDVDSVALDLSALSLNGVTTLNSSNAASYISTIDAALNTAQSVSSDLGNKLTIIQNRQDFTKNISTILQTGSDNLVAADTNEEAAKVLALQTRQSLSQSALSLANQQNQGVLQLLR